MSEDSPRFAVEEYVPFVRPNDRRRPARVAGLSVAVAGAILGAAYGGPAGPPSRYVAVLLGGVVYGQVSRAYGPEAYGDVLLGGVAGVGGSSVTVSAVLALALDLPLLSALWATAPTVLATAATVAALGFLGFVAGALVSALRVPTRDPTGLALLAVGTAGVLLAVHLGGGLRPETETLATPILSEATYARRRLYEIAGIAAGGLGVVGLASLLSSRRRRRIALAGVAVTGAALGAAGAGSVGATVGHARTTAAVAEDVSVSVASVGVAEQTVTVRLRIENPSGRDLRASGLALQMANESQPRLAYGAGQRVGDDPPTIGAGESATVTYRLGLTRTQAEELGAALDSGEVVVDGRLSLELAGGGSPLLDADRGFSVGFRATVGDDRR